MAPGLCLARGGKAHLACYCILALMELPPRMTAELAIPDQGSGGRASALAAAWLATKYSPHRGGGARRTPGG